MKRQRTELYQPIGSIREFSSTATETRLSRPSPRIVAAFVKEICNVLGTTMYGLCVVHIFVVRTSAFQWTCKGTWT